MPLTVVDLDAKKKDRDLVVVLLNGEAAVRELHRIEGGVILNQGGQDAKPQFYTDCEILGRIVQIRRAEPA